METKPVSDRIAEESLDSSGRCIMCASRRWEPMEHNCYHNPGRCSICNRTADEVEQAMTELRNAFGATA